MLWSTSTLSTLSSPISKVCRLMNPVLCTTRRSVTSVSVVNRWNQPLIVYSATTAITAAAGKPTRAIGGKTPEAASSDSATIQAAIAGR